MPRNKPQAGFRRNAAGRRVNPLFSVPRHADPVVAKGSAMPRLSRRFAPLPLIFAAVLAAALPGAAPAQSVQCAPREQVLHVIDRLGQRRQAAGDLNQGARMELFSAESGAWSLIVHLPDGRACLLAHGDAFSAMGGLQPARGRPV
jgi:hypothetical protein